MINDVIEIELNGKQYKGKMDMGAIALAQHNLIQIKENITIVEMFELAKKENYLVINSLLIESIRRYHKTATGEQILENMKLAERNKIIGYIYELMAASFPKEEGNEKIKK